MKSRTIKIDTSPQAVQCFFRELGDQPVLVELGGKPLCVLYPAVNLVFQPDGELIDPKGAWTLPLDVVQAIDRTNS